MSNIEFKIDMSELERAALELGKPEQFRFAASLLLNSIIYRVQQKVWDRLLSNEFHIRRQAFNKGAIYFPKENRATTQNLVAVLEIKPIAENLIHLETGEPENPLKKYLIVPNPQVFRYKIITSKNKLHPMNLDLKKVKYGYGGRERTYMINSNKTNVPMIMQRKGRGKTAKSTILYTLVKRIKVPAKLQFIELGNEVMEKDFERLAQEALAKAIATAR